MTTPIYGSRLRESGSMLSP